MISKHGLFQLSQKADYGLYLLTELARLPEGEPISLHTIAKEHRMSFFFLQKVARDLKEAGLIRSSRGKAGGYSLAKKVADINLQQILEALEGPIGLMPCLTADSGEPCSRKGRCRMRRGFQFINQILINTLHTTSLDHLLRMP